MGKSAPKAPDPKETAGAQTANNIGTAIANQSLGNVNQVTPTGSLMYSQSGSTEWTDPNTGKVYDIPNYTAETSLSKQEQGIFNSEQAARQSLADLGRDSANRLGSHLNQSLDFAGLPQGGSADGLNTPRYQQLGNIEQMQTSFAPSGAIQSGVASRSGELQRSVPSRSNQLQRSIQETGFSANVGDAGDITKTYGTDFSDRRRVEEALLSRLNPNIERDKEALRTSLLNQGIREGSEAFDRAMNRSNEQSTDARMQAILAGGQEQSRLADLEARRAGFENAAQQQQYAQNFGNAQLGFNVQQATAAERLARGQFANAATNAAYNQDFSSGQFRNAAVNSAYNQDLSSGQFANAAQQQRFGQGLSRANFANAATASNNDSAFNVANYGNNIADRSFANDQTLQNRMDTDRQLATQEMLMARNQPINEIGALLGTGQVQMPNFVNTNSPQMATVDRAGLENAAYQGQLNAYNARQSTLGSLLGTAGQIGAAVIG